MANDFSGDSNCVARYRFESGAMTTDSIGGNTLTPTGPPAEDTTNYKEGSCAAVFGNSATYYTVTDANLDADFPLKDGDTIKKGTWVLWCRPTLVDSHYHDIISKSCWIVAYQRSLAFYILNNNKMQIHWGWNLGAD